MNPNQNNLKQNESGEENIIIEIKNKSVMNTCENIMNEKICTKCNHKKNKTEFYTDKRRVKDKYLSICKKCTDQQNRMYALTHKESIKSYKKLYDSDPENRFRILISKRKYREKNREILNKKSSECILKRKQKDPVFKMITNLRIRLSKAIKRGYKKGKTLELLGCTWSELKNHLEKQFKPGMSWDNYGKWHVDHIKPCNSFNLQLETEQKICFNYKNLQPLWAKDNLAKSDNYTGL